MNYPKVLIIGNSSFNARSADGVTLRNLMHGWDIDKIAVVGRLIIDPDFEICKKYYLLGDLECKHRFPFNLWRRKYHQTSGELKQNEQLMLPYPNHYTNESCMKSVYNYILEYTGLIHYKDNIIISEKLAKWISNYAPDVIYSMLSSLELIRFIELLRNKLNKPVAIHIMDDWPVTITANQQFIFRSFWKSKIDREFRKLLKVSVIFLSISEAMSEEYQQRYGISFLPFHNPIDISFWGKHSRINYSIGEPFVILYAGRIGNGLKQCLIEIASVISNLTASNYNIEFHIQSTSNNPIASQLAEYKFVKFNPIVSYAELPRVFAQADLLVIPNDFDKKSIEFLKYSMPTKASEYMASGTPILVYSSKETAILKHAILYRWAYAVSENKAAELENAIKELYINENLRQLFGTTAKAFANKNYDNEIIRNKFREALTPQPGSKKNLM